VLVSGSEHCIGTFRPERTYTRRSTGARWNSSLSNWPSISSIRKLDREALRRWLRAGVEFMATKKGLAAALAMAAHGSSELVTYSLDRLTWAVGEQLRRAAAAGEIRADIDPEDLLRALVGMCYAYDGTAWQPKVLRLIDVLVDGLRQRPDKTQDRQACEGLPYAQP